jgi:hypothetical protein
MTSRSIDADQQGEDRQIDAGGAERRELFWQRLRHGGASRRQ